MIRAVEFFSGIGAFSQAAKFHGVEVVAAFDQSTAANETFVLNHRLLPRSKNLDSISKTDIPPSDLWWMSPPCTPYTVRGKQKDVSDPRARSLLNLIGLIPDIGPETILIENVLGFDQSQVHSLLSDVLCRCGYKITQISLCSTDFGIPMRRPRLFLAAAKQTVELPKPEPQPKIALSAFLRGANSVLTIDAHTVTRYGAGFDIVDFSDPAAELICFTKGYARCMKASGSILRLSDGMLRRFSPQEILSLLGFSDDFVFPVHLDMPTQWRLLGNSVDVRAIDFLLSAVAAMLSQSVLTR